MNLLIPKFTFRRSYFDRLWAAVRSTSIAPYLSHEGDLPLAHDLARLGSHGWMPGMAKFLFDRPLQGAGYAYESRRWLMPASDATIATTGANTRNFNVYDFFSISVIGFVWTVAGTVTALVMDFDLYPQLNAGGTVVDKLDGTNGVITAPTVAGQAIANILYKNLGHDPGEIDVSPSQSVQAIVTTTTTAGNGIPIIVGFARSEEFLNHSTAVKSS